MKRTRLLSLVVTIALILSLSPFAFADLVYTHPSGTYGYMVPDGWVAVDKHNIDFLVSAGIMNTAVAGMVNQIEDERLSMIIQQGNDTTVFADNLNVLTFDNEYGTPADFVALYAEQFDEGTVAADPNVVIVAPMQVVPYENWEVVVFAYNTLAFNLSPEGLPITYIMVFLFTENIMYQLTFTGKSDNNATNGSMIDALIESFFVK